MSDLSARSPSTSLSAPRIIDFPVPVSPVTTLKPGTNSQSSDSTNARFRIRKDRSVAGTERLCKGAAAFFQYARRCADHHISRYWDLHGRTVDPLLVQRGPLHRST